jgi:isocitrate/isopropylmalate dehydrogenase
MAYLDHADAAERIDAVVVDSIREGATTPDLGGSMKTDEVGAWIAERVAS